MTAAVANLTGDSTIEAGTTTRRVIPLRYPNGDPVNLTPYTDAAGGELRGQFRHPNVDGTTVVFQVTNDGSDADPTPDSGVYIEAPATAGNLVIVLSDSDTSAAQSNSHLSGYYDIEGVTSADVVARLVQGNWDVSKESTRTML